MTLLTTGRRRAGVTLPAATETAPYAPITWCTIPAYPTGNTNTIHPSVHDFEMSWNGYRWWMANTPYPADPDENPCIYASNDGVTWATPPGLTNPIDPWPGQATSNGGWYNSDTELVVDDAGNLVCIYREVEGSTERIRARVSADGVTWGAEQLLFTSALGSTSPAVVRWGPGDFRLWTINSGGGSHWTAPHPLGPWQLVEANLGYAGAAYHGDVIRYSDTLTLLAASDTAKNVVRLAHSTDGGIGWTSGQEVAGGGIVTPYRPTITRSPKPGWVDMWIGGAATDGSGGNRTAYTRVPLSAFYPA